LKSYWLASDESEDSRLGGQIPEKSFRIFRFRQKSPGFKELENRKKILGGKRGVEDRQPSLGTQYPSEATLAVFAANPRRGDYVKA
jgi:hypothetical protein